jgi:hypothetical protein
MIDTVSSNPGGSPVNRKVVTASYPEYFPTSSRSDPKELICVDMVEYDEAGRVSTVIPGVSPGGRMPNPTEVGVSLQPCVSRMIPAKTATINLYDFKTDDPFRIP